jgi:DNA-binding response OmpR family regulator
LREIWEYHATARTRALDVVVSRLRRKFRLYAPDDELLETVWGVGYRLLGELPGTGGVR